MHTNTNSSTPYVPIHLTSFINLSATLMNDSSMLTAAPFNVSKCLPIQVVFPDPVDNVWLQTTFGTMYSFVLVVGLFANALTLYCLTSAPYHFGMNSKFLISLTATDVIMGLTSLPATAIQIFSRRWLFGTILCQLIPLFQGACFFVNSLTLAAIAIERFLNITKGKSVCAFHSLIVGCIWLIGFLVSVPYAWYMELRPDCIDDNGTLLCMCGEFCDEHWPNVTAKRSFGSTSFLIQFGMPLCVLTFCYCTVRRTVHMSVQRRMINEHLSTKSKKKLILRKKRTSLVTLLLLLSFLGPWLPVSVLNLLKDFERLKDDWYMLTMFGFTHLVAMTSILLNPIIYCLYNRDFLELFKFVLFCKTTSKKIEEDDEVDEREKEQEAMHR